MRRLPVIARAYVSTMTVLGACVFAAAVPLLTLRHPLLSAGLLALGGITGLLKIRVPLAKSGFTVSVLYAAVFASMLLDGIPQAILVSAAGTLSQCLFPWKRRVATYQILFNVACISITVQAAGVVFVALGGIPGTIAPTRLETLIGAAAIYLLVNTITISMAIALATSQSVRRVLTESVIWAAPGCFAGALAAGLTVDLVNRSGYWLAMVVAPALYGVYRLYGVRIEHQQQHVQQLADVHLASIEALALAIDAKGPTGQAHVQRVQAYATALARACGMSEPEIEGVRTAALLHDIGKLAVPEHILSKPGPLTPDEFQKVQIHADVGAKIVASVPFQYPVERLIRSHHERWDGDGYPEGLKGEEIPLGARILTVVDWFDAMTSERPYHRRITSEAALDVVRQEAGKALDPMVVRKFIELLPTVSAELDAIKSNPPEPLPTSQKSIRPELHAPVVTTTNVFDDIARAHRESYALYEMAQELGKSLSLPDTMKLVASSLSSLVPFSSCALFLVDEDKDVLTCHFATGIDAELLQAISVRNGLGVCGWVARNRLPLVNGRPSADLDAAGRDSSSMQLQAALACPLIFKDKLIGTLSVYHVEPGRFQEDDRRLLDSVCVQAAAVIANSLTFEHTKRESLRDPLTGLPNTRYLATHLTGELARAERLGSTVALLMIDLDDFKAINDTFGHQSGDRALQEVARVLHAATRPYDFCVRYGGDEFIIVLSGCGRDEAEDKRLELQAAIQQVCFEPSPNHRVELAISAGSAIFPVDGESYERLVAVADSRMYSDKAARKRRSLSRVS